MSDTLYLDEPGELTGQIRQCQAIKRESGEYSALNGLRQDDWGWFLYFTATPTAVITYHSLIVLNKLQHTSSSAPVYYRVLLDTGIMAEVFKDALLTYTVPLDQHLLAGPADD